MNGIENISERIMSEARAKADDILKAAAESAAKAEAEWREKAERDVAAITAAGKARCDDVLERAKLSAGIEVRKITAGKKQELIDGAFSQALRQLAALEGDEYVELLSTLAAKACEGGFSGELLLNERDRAAHGEAVLKAANKKLGMEALTLGGDSAPISGGVVVRNGKVEMNCAFEVVVRMLKEEISGEVAACLFGKGA